MRSSKMFRNGLNLTLIRLNNKHIIELEAEFQKWLNKDYRSDASIEISVTEFMLYQVQFCVDGINKLKHKLSDFNRRYLKSADNDERKQHILDFSSELGSTITQLIHDKKAFRRWFDRDAILDRYNSILLFNYQRLSFYLNRLGWVYSTALDEQQNIVLFWKRFDIEKVVRPLFSFDGDNRIRVSAFQCIARALYAIPCDKKEGLVSDATMQ